MAGKIRITPPSSSPPKRRGGSGGVALALKKGGIAVISTDTLYGVVARAFDKKAVARLYALRRETRKKPFIVLISSIQELAAFGIQQNAAALQFLKTVWPGKVSVILPCNTKQFSYLHLGTKTVAFRFPKSVKLRSLLRKTGPLVVPSANREGEKPAETIAEAKKYFGNAVDMYVNAGRRHGTPSTLISLIDGTPKILRVGAVRI